MRDVARRFPADDDVATLTAEAMMGVNAWKLWTLDGKPADGTRQIVALLEQVLARNPRHPGANHYYIHAVEASPDPGRAAAAADRLGAMMPAAGHLVHMPSHIYQRIGRYADAAAVNDVAARADLAYLDRTRPPDYYAIYTGHNWWFEAFAAVNIGRHTETLAAVRRARALFSDADLAAGGDNGWGTGAVYFMPARFGDWAALVAAPAPDPHLPGLTAAWLWARGTALAALGRADEAAQARARLAQIDAATKPDAPAGLNNLRDMYHLALLTLDARIAGAAGDQKRRVALLQDAARAEDALAYDEPADWQMPVRPLLGRALLDVHQAEQAEAVYREDLRQRPGNGWSLLGLSQALAAQGRSADAGQAHEKFARVWASADVRLVASAY
jgi:tetratricopeptide (TPR) repeat protein